MKPQPFWITGTNPITGYQEIYFGTAGKEKIENNLNPKQKPTAAWPQKEVQW